MDLSPKLSSQPRLG